MFLTCSQFMGLKWIMNTEMRSAMFEVIKAQLETSLPEKVSRFLFLLGRAGAKWVELPEGLKNNLLIALEKECQKPLLVEQMAYVVCG
jgi:hypothetical protein